MDSDMDEEEPGPVSGNMATATLPEGANYTMNTVQDVEAMEQNVLDTAFLNGKNTLQYLVNYTVNTIPKVVHVSNQVCKVIFVWDSCGQFAMYK